MGTTESGVRHSCPDRTSSRPCSCPAQRSGGSRTAVGTGARDSRRLRGPLAAAARLEAPDDPLHASGTQIQGDCRGHRRAPRRLQTDGPRRAIAPRREWPHAHRRLWACGGVVHSRTCVHQGSCRRRPTRRQRTAAAVSASGFGALHESTMILAFSSVARLMPFRISS